MLNEEMNVFWENKYGMVMCETATRNVERGRRGASDARAVNGMVVKMNGVFKVSVVGMFVVVMLKEGGVIVVGRLVVK